MKICSKPGRRTTAPQTSRAGKSDLGRTNQTPEEAIRNGFTRSRSLAWSRDRRVALTGVLETRSPVTWTPGSQYRAPTAAAARHVRTRAVNGRSSPGLGLGEPTAGVLAGLVLECLAHPSHAICEADSCR